MRGQEVLRTLIGRAPLDQLSRCKPMSIHALPIEQMFQTLGGRITCQQCQARSKRTKQQCRAPAMKGKRVCRTHGGASTGPKTQAGRQRCTDARTIHGNETRQARTERSLASARLAVLEQVGHKMGFMNGTRTRGPKPTRMAEVYPELQVAVPDTLGIESSPGLACD
jgi:hypothetical protein